MRNMYRNIKQSYLTVLFISSPALNTNAGAANEGNHCTIQSALVGSQYRTIVTGPAQRYALRLNWEAFIDHDLLFRRSSPDGLLWGPKDAPTMAEGTLGFIGDFQDNIRPMFDGPMGTMILGSVSESDVKKKVAAALEALGPKATKKQQAEVKKQVKELEKKAREGKLRSSVLSDTAFSTTPYVHDQPIFMQGHKVDSPNLNPYTVSQHHSRYTVRVTFNLTDFHAAGNLHFVLAYLYSHLSGLQIGGRQARNSFVLHPDAILWRTHQMGGNGGLLGSTYRCEAEEVPNLDSLAARAEWGDHPFKAAGSFTVGDEWSEVVESRHDLKNIPNTCLALFAECCKSLDVDPSDILDKALGLLPTDKAQGLTDYMVGK